MRWIRQATLIGIMSLSLATMAAAQPVCDFPGSGFFGPNGCGRVDDDGDGPDSGDVPFFPTWVGPGEVELAFALCTYQLFIFGSGSNGVLDEWGRSPNFGELIFDGFGPGGVPTGASYFEGGGVELEDVNGDMVYDQIRLTDAGGGSMVFPLMLFDADNDNKPDFVHIGSILGLIEPCGPFDGSDPLFFPIGRSDDCGYEGDVRNAVFDLDGNDMADSELLCGPVLWRSAMSAPVTAVGNLALLALALALVGGSLYTLRALG